MSSHDDAPRAGLVDSMATFYGYQWIFLRALFRAVSERFGAEGLSILEQGFRRYGYYRGQYLRDRPETFAEGRDALSLVRNWDTGDYALAALHAAFEIQGSPSRVTVTFPCVPGNEYFFLAVMAAKSWGFFGAISLPALLRAMTRRPGWSMRIFRLTHTPRGSLPGPIEERPRTSSRLPSKTFSPNPLELFSSRAVRLVFLPRYRCTSRVS